jgi:hypothetical protein
LQQTLHCFQITPERSDIAPGLGVRQGKAYL